jgi:hypothetical protein
MAMRRRYSRFLPEDNEVAITSDTGLKFTAEVVDESFGGIGVLCEETEGLEEGLEVAVRIEEADFDAVIVSVRKQEDGMVQLGLKWLEIEPEENFDEESDNEG